MEEYLLVPAIVTLIFSIGQALGQMTTQRDINELKERLNNE